MKLFGSSGTRGGGTITPATHRSFDGAGARSGPTPRRSREGRGDGPRRGLRGCLPRSVGVLIAVRDVVSKLLERNDLTVADVDHFELNEPCRAMVYVADELDIPAEAHPLGGAVALGHPIGASGGILTTTMLYAMERADHHRGIVG